MEKCVYISIFAIILTFSGLAACTGIPTANSGNPDIGTGQNGQKAMSRTASVPLFSGNGGKGLVIAVPAPSMSGGSQANSWMPQLFQDLITSDLARYSAMTVLDRLNESMVLAEQRISASGNYSDDDYIVMGRLTNARFIVAGNILSVSGRYSISFRINNTETNEIQASFSKQYILEDIESGLAAKEAALALLTGMGVELTDEGKRQLLTIQERSVRSQVRLAQGMAAQRNNDELQALVFFQEALNANQGMREASQRIQSFGQGSPGASIRERAEWATTQKTRWEKIFNDLVDYVDKNLVIAVYDFSAIEDQFDALTNKVTLTVSPGVKIIPDSTVLNVWKTVVDQWEQIKRLEENRSWANSLTIRRSNISRDWQDIRQGIGKSQTTTDRSFYAITRLYDDARIRISQNAVRFSSGLFIEYKRDLQILPRERYFNNRSFQPIKFVNVSVSDITDNLSVEASSIAYGLIYAQEGQSMLSNASYSTVSARIMSVQEWNEWVKNQ